MACPERYYRAALICGLAPLATGVGIFLLWTVIGGNELAFAGLLTIVLGTISVVAGGVCLGIYAERSSGTVPKLRLRRQLRIAATALLINFPAALLVVVAVAFLVPSQVTVDNHGPDIERFAVSGGGAEVNVGEIASGNTIVVRIVVWRGDTLKFHATRAGQDFRGLVEGHVRPGAAGFPFLIFNRDGSWGSFERDEDDVGGMPHF